MASRLTLGMYGDMYSHKSNLFGIHCGQVRGNETVHNAGWYNRAGEKLGWGDLSTEDILRISRELQEGELFIILGEQDSYWNFRSRKSGQTEENPGVDYVIEKCRLVIAPGCVYYPDREGYVANKTNFEYRNGLLCTVITARQLKKLIRLSIRQRIAKSLARAISYLPSPPY